jgi:hypothetical protein
MPRLTIYIGLKVTNWESYKFFNEIKSLIADSID